jgi:hypothetical protein
MALVPRQRWEAANKRERLQHCKGQQCRGAWRRYAPLHRAAHLRARGSSCNQGGSASLPGGELRALTEWSGRISSVLRRRAHRLPAAGRLLSASSGHEVCWLAMEGPHDRELDSAGATLPGGAEDPLGLSALHQQAVEGGWLMEQRDFDLENREVLGAGSVGQIYKCRHLPSGELCAVKAVRQDLAESDLARNRTVPSPSTRTFPP